MVKASSLQLSSIIFRQHSTWHTKKNKLLKTLDYGSRDMLSFDFLVQGLGIVSSPYFLHDFLSKTFLLLYSVNQSNFIFWMPLLHEILGNIFIGIFCFLVCDVMKFKTNLIFLIKPVFYMTKKSRQKIKYLQSEKSF